MTELEFILAHTQDPKEYNTPYTININYDEIGDGKGKITGITVTNIPLISSDIRNVEEQLGQLEEITFRIDNQKYTCKPETIEHYPNTAQPEYSFYYYRITPIIFTIGTLEGIEIPVNVQPYLDQTLYKNSDYNPLINNVEDQRTSYIVMECDRNYGTVNPSNLQAIQSGSATKASIQDSLYSDTGWTNSRYNGTKTSSQNYLGLIPILQGSTFTGEVFANQISNGLICSYSLADRKTSTLFTTGKDLVPKYNGLLATRYKAAEAITSATATRVKLAITTDSLYISSSLVYVNDIIALSNGLSTEYMKISNIEEVENGRIEVTVLRAYEQKPTLPLSNIPVNTPVNRLDSTSLYTYGKIGKDVAQIPKLKVWVQSTDTILFTDSYGAVTGSFQCS